MFPRTFNHLKNGLFSKRKPRVFCWSRSMFLRSWIGFWRNRVWKGTAFRNGTSPTPHAYAGLLSRAFQPRGRWGPPRQAPYLTEDERHKAFLRFHCKFLRRPWYVFATTWWSFSPLGECSLTVGTRQEAWALLGDARVPQCWVLYVPMLNLKAGTALRLQKEMGKQFHSIPPTATGWPWGPRVRRNGLTGAGCCAVMC